MPMLHLVLADRLNWPIYAVRSPKHIFCRYIEKGFKKNNIEATCGGGYIPDRTYISDSKIPKKPLKNGVYLRTLTQKEYIANMLSSCARYSFEYNKDLKKAIYYTELCVKYDSTFSGAYWNLNKYYYKMAYQLETEMLKIINKMKRYYSNHLELLHNQAVNNKHSLQESFHWNYQNRNKVDQKGMIQPLNPLISPAPAINNSISLLPDMQPVPQQFNNFNNDSKLQNSITELRIDTENKIENIERKYIPLIKEALFRSEWYEKKVKES
jgi:hypothetical protein